MHPAAADCALHTGAVNPSAPQDGATRVPAALAALLVPSASEDQVRSLRPERLCCMLACMHGSYSAGPYLHLPMFLDVYVVLLFRLPVLISSHLTTALAGRWQVLP